MESGSPKWAMNSVWETWCVEYAPESYKTIKLRKVDDKNRIERDHVSSSFQFSENISTNKVFQFPGSQKMLILKNQLLE